jgi:heat shock protein HslJ
MRRLITAGFLCLCMHTYAQFKTVYVKGEKTTCETGTCYEYKNKPAEKWKIFNGEILNFNFEEGYNYTLKVRAQKVYNAQRADSIEYWRIAKIISKTKYKIPAVVLAGKWAFVKMIYKRTETDLTKYPKLFIQFDTVNKRAGGRSFCNTFNGILTKKADSITLGKFASTRMACENGTLEEDMFQTFREVNNYKIAGKTLYLKNNDQLVFELKLL